MPAHWLTDSIVVEDDEVNGYGDATYGDAFADIYDEWYHGISDVAATVRYLAALIPPGGAVLELGVGTGRLAIPLAAVTASNGHAVHGLDASAAMLARLAENDPAGTVRPVLGDMVGGLPDGSFGLVFVAYNTFFNLLSDELQAASFAAVAQRLTADGSFVIEAFVPDDDDPGRSDNGPGGGPGGGSSGAVSVRSMTTERVVLSVSRGNRDDQMAEGQYIDISAAGGVRLRPWSIHYRTPAQLDDLAEQVGLTLLARLEAFDGTPFTADSGRHVSVYGRNSRARPHGAPGHVLG
jgi:SAM-dependent methyltransferase